MGINKSQVEDLIEIGMGLDLYRSPEGEAYAAYTSRGRKVNTPVRSPEFSGYLRAAYRAANRRGANSNALREAVEELEYHALERGEVHQVFLRTASREGVCYLDLADEHGTVLRSGHDGWSADPNHPVRFKRTPAMHPLPLVRLARAEVPTA